jgi:Domain of Unknown Function with PDB structure (DUF3857)
MKNLFTLILCMGLQQVFSQTQIEKDLKTEIWTNTESEFKTAQVPDQWKNESAIILALKRDYLCEYRSHNYQEKVTVHYRIKLIDKAAVNTFSELAFDDNSGIKSKRASTYSVMGAKVIKPNGNEKEVDLTTAVKSDLGSSREMKMPIPNLEPGDILDYYFVSKEENPLLPYFSDIDILEKRYPIVTATYRFTIPKQSEFVSLSFNGAPTFKKEVLEDKYIYTLRDEMRSKAPDALWEYEYRTSPHIRYRITHGQYADTKTKARNTLERFQINMSDVGPLIDFMDGNFKKEKDDKKILCEVVHALNNPIYKKLYFNIQQHNPLEAGEPGDLYFALINKYLVRRKIGHEVLIAPSREFGSFADIMSLGQCDLMIRINTDPPFYIQRPGPFSVPGEIPATFEGMEMVRESFNTESGINTLPVSSAEDNLTATILKLDFNEEDNSKINVHREVRATGHSKLFHQYMVYTNYDYLKEYDQPKYQVQSSHRMRSLLNDYNEEKKKFEQRQVQDYNERDQRIKHSLETEMDVKLADYKNLQIKNIGMWYDKPNTEYSDEFTIENIVKKAGPNIILELGKLLEKQTEVTDEQKIRTRDVNMSNARSFTYSMALTIPTGYSVEGIENFNKKVESEFGGFVSEAHIANNVLMVTTKKYYTKNQYTPEAWPKITEFLTAAVDFYNAKILLKK